MKLFQKKIKLSPKGLVATDSVEDKHVVYVDTPDGLRLRFRDGEYDGWYLPEGGANG